MGVSFQAVFNDMRRDESKARTEFNQGEVNDKGGSFVKLDQVLQRMIWLWHHSKTSDKHSPSYNQSRSYEMIQRSVRMCVYV